MTIKDGIIRELNILTEKETDASAKAAYLAAIQIVENNFGPDAKKKRAIERIKEWQRNNKEKVQKWNGKWNEENRLEYQRAYRKNKEKNEQV